MNKSIITYIIAAVIAIMPAIMVQAAPGTGDSASSAAPSTGGSTSSAASPSPSPSTGGSTSSAASPSPAPSTGGSISSASPSTGGSTSSAGTGAPSTGGSTSSASPSTGGSTSSAGTTAPSTGGSTSSADASTQSSTVVGGNVPSGSSSYYGTGSGYAYNLSCQLLPDYAKIGWANKAEVVTQLQNFLKNTENLDVDVNGTFDQKTESAVMAFQRKYAESILAPWGVTEPTGYVYVTTLKKINQIACNQPLTLNSSELAMINAYKQSQADKQAQAGAQVGSLPAQTGPSIDNGSSTNGATEIGATEGNEANTATVANPSILGRFWSFIVGLFR